MEVGYEMGFVELVILKVGFVELVILEVAYEILQQQENRQKKFSLTINDNEFERVTSYCSLIRFSQKTMSH